MEKCHQVIIIKKNNNKDIYNFEYKNNNYNIFGKPLKIVNNRSEYPYSFKNSFQNINNINYYLNDIHLYSFIFLF